MWCILLSQTDLWWLIHSSLDINPAWKCAMCKDDTRVNCPWFPNSALCTWCTYVTSTHFSSFFFCEAFLLASLALPATQEVHSKFLSAFFVVNYFGSVFFPDKQPVHASPIEVSLFFVVFSILLEKGRCMHVCVCVCMCACTHIRWSESHIPQLRQLSQL